MARRRKKAAVPFTAADIANMAKTNPYLQRILEDAKLRSNVRTAVDSSKSAYARLMNGKAPHRALLNDKKLQRDIGKALQATRDAAAALSDAPKRRARRGLTVTRTVTIVAVSGGVVMVASDKVRSKVLDTLFGAEEEFEYTPPSTSAPSTGAPVGAA